MPRQIALSWRPIVATQGRWNCPVPFDSPAKYRQRALPGAPECRRKRVGPPPLENPANYRQTAFLSAP
eukprot:2562190-Lingulodinium_polyedra.AAC.1